jgi:hypothetical protein
MLLTLLLHGIMRLLAGAAPETPRQQHSGPSPHLVIVAKLMEVRKVGGRRRGVDCGIGHNHVGHDGIPTAPGGDGACAADLSVTWV